MIFKNAENAGDGLASPKGESSLLSEAVVVRSTQQNRKAEKSGALNLWLRERMRVQGVCLEGETPTFVLLLLWW